MLLFIITIVVVDDDAVDGDDIALAVILSYNASVNRGSVMCVCVYVEIDCILSLNPLSFPLSALIPLS